MNISKMITTLDCHSADQDGHDSSNDTSPKTLFQVIVMMLVMAGPKAGHDSGLYFVNDAPHYESLCYQVIIMMLITMLRMNDDDGPDIEHVVISHRADNQDCFANAKCLILSPASPFASGKRFRDF